MKIPAHIPVAVGLLFSIACSQAPDESSTPAPPTAAQSAFLDTLSQRSFRYFWELAPPSTGLTPDRWPTPSFSSIAAIGFGLTAYTIGAEHGWVTRGDAAARTLATLRFLWNLPQGPAASGTGGYKGFFYHFLEPATGHRFEQVELSTIDTSLLLLGVLTCQMYFDGASADEGEIRALADSLYRRVEWDWAQPRAPLVAMGWKPGQGYLANDWEGYNEAMLLYVLALGSPTHPIADGAWDAWTSTYRWGSFYGEDHLGFAPLFGHQYSHAWIDFRGIQDGYMRTHGSDYFVNAQRATRAQHAYAVDNPGGWAGYGNLSWGLTACDGPADVTLAYGGTSRRFFTYAARGASFTEIRDDGTITPHAAGGSVAFAPDLTIPALMDMRRRFGDNLWGEYGFRDAYNETFTFNEPTLHGRVVPGVGWFDNDYLGIDVGPTLLMIENYRTGFLWNLMRRHPAIRRGLQRAGFQGGWLTTDA